MTNRRRTRFTLELARDVFRRHGLQMDQLLPRPIGWDLSSSADKDDHHGNEGNPFGSDEGGRKGTGGQGKDQNSNRGGKHGVEESKCFEPDDPPHNKRRRAREELPKTAVKMTMRVMVVKARRRVVKAFRNDFECKIAALVDTCSFSLSLPFLPFIPRIA